MQTLCKQLYGKLSPGPTGSPYGSAYIWDEIVSLHCMSELIIQESESSIVRKGFNVWAPGLVPSRLIPLRPFSFYLPFTYLLLERCINLSNRGQSGIEFADISWAVTSHLVYTTCIITPTSSDKETMGCGRPFRSLILFEGILEVKLPTIWTDGKAKVGRIREEKRRKKKIRKKMQARERVEKSRNTLFFQWFVAPEGRKAGSLKRRVRSHLGRWERKNCTPLWREADLEVKMYKAHQVRKHFWKLRCRKSARHCGAKHASKSKCTTHVSVGALRGFEMFKKCTPLWREAHFQVKM